jgi:protein-tyrosine phosphatase
VIDLHAHVLPGVDDGAPDLATSLEMLRASHREGVREIVATPHQHPGRYPNAPARLREAHQELCAAILGAEARGEALPLVHLGAEVHLDADLPERIESGDLLTLAGSSTVLLELPDVFPLGAVEELIWTLHLRGIRTLLAHPERIGQIARVPAQLGRLVSLGALAQLTGASIAGDFGAPCRDLSARLIADGLCHVVSSDAHDLKRRPPVLGRARKALEQVGGADLATRLVETNPAAILAGHEVEGVPEPSSGPRTWRSRLASWLRRDSSS